MSSEITNIIDVVADGLTRFCAMPQSTAETLARAIMFAAAEAGHAGAEYYLPALHTTLTPAARRDRNDAIRREFNGQNMQEIRRKYGLSRTSIYMIVRRGE